MARLSRAAEQSSTKRRVSLSAVHARLRQRDPSQVLASHRAAYLRLSQRLYQASDRVQEQRRTRLDGIREQYRRACAEVSAPASAEDFAAQQAILLGVEESSYQEGLNRLCLAHPICAMAVMIIRIEEKFMIVPVIRDDIGSQTLLDCLLDHSSPDASRSTEETPSSPG